MFQVTHLFTFAVIDIIFRTRLVFTCSVSLSVFRDINTKIPVDNSHELAPGIALPDCVYMDTMGLGMGCCCLQLTFQACGISEARTLYDQLAPLCPIMVSRAKCFKKVQC